MVDELKSVVGELGGQDAVGRPVHSGFPHAAVEGLLESSGLTLKEMASSLDLSLRSLQRRKSQGRLARYESDRLYRLARLLALAEYFLGDRQAAIDWLRRPNRVLGGRAPLSVVDTELGARQVENILGRIGYGGVS
jgi:putative toxin-antitoxin system antitoxin component (TIGR02293 family)